MKTTEIESRWTDIEQQTSALMEQITMGDTEELQRLLQRRQEELEAFFQELEYTPAQLERIEGRIVDLLERDSSMINACLEQQSSLLDQSKQLRETRKGADAYSLEARRLT